MSISPSRLTAAGAGLAVAAVTASLLAAPASAAPATPHRLGVAHHRVAAAAGWLTTQFAGARHLPTPGGTHFDSKYGTSYYPNYGENADVIFALAAAHSGASTIHTALAYLRRNIDAYANTSGSAPYDGSVAKAALAAIVAGAHPRRFGGVDLLHTLVADECTAAAPKKGCPAAGSARNIYSSISESFVLLAEKRGGVTPTAAATTYFLSLQCANGGFTSGTAACGSGAADIDATSYAIMALDAVGGHPLARQRAAAWLAGQQKPGGYWRTQQIPNTDSTGLAAAALAGTKATAKARSWLRTQQVGAGHPGAGAFRYGHRVTATTTSATSPSVLATAQAVTGLMGRGSLATVSAARATRGSAVYAPRVSRPHARVAPLSHQIVRGFGYAAGERVRLRVLPQGRAVGSSIAGPLGVVTVHYRVPTLHPGRHVLSLHGVSSGLTARGHVVIGAVRR